MSPIWAILVMLTDCVLSYNASLTEDAVSVHSKVSKDITESSLISQWFVTLFPSYFHFIIFQQIKLFQMSKEKAHLLPMAAVYKQEMFGEGPTQSVSFKLQTQMKIQSLSTQSHAVLFILLVCKILLEFHRRITLQNHPNNVSEQRPEKTKNQKTLTARLA